MKLKIILASAVVALGIVGGFMFPVAKNLSLGQALPQVVAVFETSLASPISTSATSMTLTANSVRGGSALSGFNCFAVDEGSAQSEFICGTVSGTTVSSLQRGVDPATGTSTVASLQFAHRRGANVKITDFPVITILRNQANGVETFPNLLSYADTVSIGVGSPTTTITTKAYVDGVAVAGASNGDESTKGIWEGATALEQASSTILGGTSAGLLMQSRYATDTPLSGCASGYTSTAGAGCSVIATLAGKIKQAWFNLAESWTFTGGLMSTASSTFTATTTFTGRMIGANLFASSTAGSTITGNTLPQPVSMSTSTGRVNPADANDLQFFDNFYGFAVQSGASGVNVLVQTDGVVPGFSGLTVGATYYVQDTAGTIGTSVGTYEMKVGMAISGTEVKIERGQGEYLGSVAFTQSYAQPTTCQMTATSTYMANKFISDLDGAGGGGGAPVTYNVTLPSARRGATAVNSSVTLGSPSTNGNYTVSLTGNVITATAGYSNGGSNGSCSGTLYMYR